MNKQEAELFAKLLDKLEGMEQRLRDLEARPITLPLPNYYTLTAPSYTPYDPVETTTTGGLMPNWPSTTCSVPECDIHPFAY